MVGETEAYVPRIRGRMTFWHLLDGRERSEIAVLNVGICAETGAEWGDFFMCASVDHFSRDAESELCWRRKRWDVLRGLSCDFSGQGRMGIKRLWGEGTIPEALLFLDWAVAKNWMAFAG